MSDQTQDLGSFETVGILGVIYLGVAISSMLYGFTCLQTFYYFRAFKHGKWQLGAVVALVWVLDTAHQALVIDAGYSIIISDYGHLDSVTSFSFDWNLVTTLIINGILISVVDLFFLQRLWNLSNKKWYSAIIGVFIVVHFGLYITFAAESGRIEFYSSDGPGFVLLAGLCADFFLDLMLCVGLVRELRPGRRGFPGSGDFVSRIIVMTVSTGVLTTIAALANIIALVSPGAPGLFYLFNFIIGKIYVNSLLTTLHAREGMRARMISHRAVLPSTLPSTTDLDLEGLTAHPALSLMHNEQQPIYNTTATVGSQGATREDNVHPMARDSAGHTVMDGFVNEQP